MRTSARATSLRPDLLIILGGPIGVYEEKSYPFIARERNFLRQRLEENRPTLGICLGAQLIVSALGEKVFPSGVKEIGFSPLRPTDAGRSSPLRYLENIAVLHWHGDTYSRPPGPRTSRHPRWWNSRRSRSDPTSSAFSFILKPRRMKHSESWLVGHAIELASAFIDVSALRREAQERGPLLREVATLVLGEWLAQLRGEK